MSINNNVQNVLSDNTFNSLWENHLFNNNRYVTLKKREVFRIPLFFILNKFWAFIIG